MIIAWHSPCPWLADTIHGAVIMVAVWCMATLVIAYVRITIGNRIKTEWPHKNGMFYFGASNQLGILLGTIPIYILVNIFGLFVERQPCQAYCLA